MGTLFNKAVSQAVVLASSGSKESLGERMQFAGLNTLVGLTVVFAILTIIIFIISLLKIIPYLQNKFKANSEAVDNAVAQITEQEEAEEELVSDCELVAVITAAICASMGNEIPADGLVVRSIRRLGKKSWMNA